MRNVPTPKELSLDFFLAALDALGIYADIIDLHAFVADLGPRSERELALMQKSIARDCAAMYCACDV
jgi:hypothetical protein